MKKFLVEHESYNSPLKKYGTNRGYDGFCDVFDTLEEANKAACDQWYHMTKYDRECAQVYVLVVTENDLSDWAIDDDTGEIDWTAYANADYPEGGIRLTGLNSYNVDGNYQAHSIKDVIKNTKVTTLWLIDDETPMCSMDEGAYVLCLENAYTDCCCLSTNGDPFIFYSFNELWETEKDEVTRKDDPEDFWNALARRCRKTPDELESYSDDQLLEAVRRRFGYGEGDFIQDLAYEECIFYGM